MTEKVRYITEISDIPQLSPGEVRELEQVTRIFPFGANSYYLGLINWQDKGDPLRRLVIPISQELEDREWGAIDPSCEADYTVAPGIQHKYADTVLLLLNDSCGGRCRYCFRKRLFMGYMEPEILRDYGPAIRYIKNHSEINNVLLTGGDPLRLGTESLRRVLYELRQIDHVQIIRIGTKMPAYDPLRIIGDDELPGVIREFSTPQRRMYFMLHFSHPNEITTEAIEAVNILLESGAVLCNQTPLIGGVNDDPDVLAELFKKLSFIGVSPYYVFQTRPAVGNKPYALPVVEAFRIFQEAMKSIAGTARRAIFVMSHRLGKIEVVGLDDSRIYMRYHRSLDPGVSGELIVARRNDEGYWFDDFEILTPQISWAA